MNDNTASGAGKTDAANAAAAKTAAVKTAAVKTDYWDDWQREALAAGVRAPLAKLGMEVLRSHRKNRWPKEFLGREDDAPHMLAMCLEDPEQTEFFFIENLYPYDAALIEKTRKRLGL